MNVVPESVNQYVSAALAGSGIICPSQGRLFSLSGYIDSTAATDEYYVMCLNGATVPADGAVTNLVLPYSVRHTNGTTTSFEVPLPYPITGGAGLVWCISTTPFNKTVAGSVAAVMALYMPQ